MAKYKRKLVADIEKQKTEEKIQSDLKDKYNIQDPDVVVVEKSNMIKFLIHLLQNGREDLYQSRTWFRIYKCKQSTHRQTKNCQDA